MVSWSYTFGLGLNLLVLFPSLLDTPICDSITTAKHEPVLDVKARKFYIGRDTDLLASLVSKQAVIRRVKTKGRG